MPGAPGGTQGQRYPEVLLGRGASGEHGELLKHEINCPTCLLCAVQHRSRHNATVYRAQERHDRGHVERQSLNCMPLPGVLECRNRRVKVLAQAGSQTFQGLFVRLSSRSCRFVLARAREPLHARRRDQIYRVPFFIKRLFPLDATVPKIYKYDRSPYSSRGHLFALSSFP